MRTLGAYIRFIPAQDQQMIAIAVEVKRSAETRGKGHIHRGMVALLPIEEIIDALRNYEYFQRMQTQAQQAATIAQYHQAKQMQLTAMQQPTTTGTYSKVVGGGGGGGGGLGGYPYGALGGLSQTYNLSTQPNYECMLAYAALMVALGFMKRDEGQEKDTLAETS